MSEPPSQNQLKDRIRKWLEEQGYPLEMHVAEVFQKRHFRVFQSEYYSDPDSGQQRETDVVASKQRDFGEFIVRVKVVMECKRTPEKPWLLFTSATRLAMPARVAQRCGSKLGRQLLYALAQNDEIQKLDVFKLDENSAYAVVQAFSSGADTTFAAAMSVAKASSAFGADIDRSPFFANRIAEIVLPVIVIEAPLFECNLDDRGTLNVGKVTFGNLVWHNPVGGTPHTIIRIITVEELPNFVNEVERSIESIFLAYEANPPSFQIKSPKKPAE